LATIRSELPWRTAIVSHLADFPPERTKAACQRASFHAAYRYGALKAILRKSLDFEPLPTLVVEPAGLEPPRLARNLRELFDNTSKNHQRPH
jgi:hypothetical protein